MNNQVKKYQMPFGRFKGKSLEEVPLKYLDWLIGETALKTNMPTTYKHVAEYLEDPVIKMELDRILENEE